VSAKNSTAVSTIPRAEATGKLQVVTSAHVTRIDVGRRRRASGVQYSKDGETYIQTGRRRMLAVHVRELSPAAALRLPLFPKGLANNHGPSR